MSLNRRITLIADSIRNNRELASKRDRELKRLKDSIIHDNEFNRMLREKYGKPPYTATQLFSAKYGDLVVSQYSSGTSVLLKMMRRTNNWKGSTLSVPKGLK